MVVSNFANDSAKRWTWPLYVAALRVRLRCRRLLLVVCPHTATAGWAATRIELGHPGMALTPVVADPDADPDAEHVLEALLAALTAVDDHHARIYLDMVLAALPAAARTRLEALMTAGTYEYVGRAGGADRPRH